jgi:hypothetical protein
MTNLKKSAFFLIVGIGASLTMRAQQSGSDSCQLKNYQSGDQITITGTVNGTPHGLFLHIPGCQDAVVVAFPSQLQESEKTGLQPLKKDENVENLRADLKESSTKLVKVTLLGRLDIAKPVPEGGGFN